MRVMRVNRTYLASPKRASITFFLFLQKKEKEERPLHGRLKTNPAPPALADMSPLTKHVADVGCTEPPLYMKRLPPRKHHGGPSPKRPALLRAIMFPRRPAASVPLDILHAQLREYLECRKPAPNRPFSKPIIERRFTLDFNS